MNKMAMAALGLGVAYLMRNKEARDKLMQQFSSMANPMGNATGSKPSQQSQTI